VSLETNSWPAGQEIYCLLRNL